MYRMWSVGLNPLDLARIRACMDANHSLVVLSEDAPPALDDVERDKPVLLWMSQAFRERFLREDRAPIRHLEPIPKVLVLPETCSCAELEEALDAGFQDVLRGTEHSERIHRLLRRSLEKGNIRRDMDRMMREILMHRELLGRKSDTFTFLKDFIVRVSKGGTRMDILRETRDVLSELLPVTAMHVAVWGTEEEGTVPMHLCFDAMEDADVASPVVRAWTELLLGTITGLAPFCGATPCLTMFYRGDPAPRVRDMGEELRPDMRRTLLLPLCAGDVFCGVLALLLEYECPLGRDEVQALDAATAHLAVLLRTVGIPTRNSRPDMSIAS